MKSLAAHPPRKPIPALNHRQLGKRGGKSTPVIVNINYCEVTFPADPEGKDG